MIKIPSTNNPADLSPILAARLKAAAAEALKEGVILKGPKDTAKANLTPGELEKFRYSKVDLSGSPKDGDVFEARPMSPGKAAFFKANAKDGIGTMSVIRGQKGVDLDEMEELAQEREILGKILGIDLRGKSSNSGTRLNPIEITGHVIKD